MIGGRIWGTRLGNDIPKRGTKKKRLTKTQSCAIWGSGTIWRMRLECEIILARNKQNFTWKARMLYYLSDIELTRYGCRLVVVLILPMMRARHYAMQSPLRLIRSTVHFSFCNESANTQISSSSEL
jgi:hypothetical protein